MLALGPLSAFFYLGKSVRRQLMRKSSTGLTCFVPSLKVCPSFFLSPPSPPSIVVGHPRASSRSRLEGSDSAKGRFPVNGTLRSLRCKPLIVERTLFLLALFVPGGQLSLGCSRCVFLGELSSAASMQTFWR